MAVLVGWRAAVQKRGHESIADSRHRILNAETTIPRMMGKVRGAVVKVKGKKKNRTVTREMSSLIKLSTGARELMTSCVKEDPQKRPSVASLRTFPFFKGVDWDVGLARGWKPPWIPAPLTGKLVEELVEDAKEQRTTRISAQRPGWDGTSIRQDLEDDVSEAGALAVAEPSASTIKAASGECSAAAATTAATGQSGGGNALLVATYVSKPLRIIRKKRANRAGSLACSDGVSAGADGKLTSLGRFFGETVAVEVATPKDHNGGNGGGSVDDDVVLPTSPPADNLPLQT